MTVSKGPGSKSVGPKSNGPREAGKSDVKRKTVRGARAVAAEVLDSGTTGRGAKKTARVPSSHQTVTPPEGPKR